MDGRILSLGFGACLGSFWVGSVWIASECNLRQCFSQLWTSASEKGRLEPPSEPGARSPDGGECRTIGSRRGLGPARDVAVAKVVKGRHAIGCNVTCSNRPPLKCIVQPLQSSDGMFVSRKHSRRGRETRSGRPQVVSLKSRLLENEAACRLVPRCNEGGRLTEKIREEKKMEDEARVVFWSGVVLQWSMHLAGCSG